MTARLGPEERGEPIQLALPLELQPIAPVRRDDVATWPGWRALAGAAAARAVPGLALRAIVSMLGRWVLRIALPLVGAAAMLHSFPYRASVAGVPFRVEGTLLVRPGLSADTTVGNWEFPSVDGLPFGVHIAPENVDILRIARQASPNADAFATQLRSALLDQSPRIVLWLVGEALLGLLLGLLVAAALNLAIRYLRGLPRRVDEVAHRLRQLAAAAAVLCVVAGYGAATYNPHWVRESRLTGTLAAAQLFPDQLGQYYEQQSKALDVLGSVLGIQAALQDQIERRTEPATAYRIMFISDMHLAAGYPLIAEYARNYDVKLIVNTGDETEFGQPAELTPDYLAGMRELTSIAPMLWLAGNHDSPAVEAVMRTVPGVTVLGSKTVVDGSVQVGATEVQALGLTIAGVPDPRIYGGPGRYGSDDSAVTDPLERSAIDEAVGSLPGATGDASGSPAPSAPEPSDPSRFDIFATHEPVAAQQLRADLPGQIRQTNSGHTHEQNSSSSIQSDGGSGGAIDLVEGSTGAGGLDNLIRGADAPPVEFSIESVAADCQFTRVLRFQMRLPSAGSAAPVPAAYGDDVVASTIYFRPQELGSARVCSASLGVSSPMAL
jgi:predicted MPP superfamily phosphohydrolase